MKNAYPTVLALLAVVLIALIGLPRASAQAEQGVADVPMKVGVLNVDEIMLKSQAGQAIQAELKQYEQEAQKRFADENEAIKQIENDLRAGGLDDAARQEKTMRLEQARVALNRSQQDAQREYQKLMKERFAVLDQAVGRAVEILAKQQQISVIFDARSGSGVLYHDNASDLTAQVIQMLDKQ